MKGPGMIIGITNATGILLSLLLLLAGVEVCRT